MLLGCKKFERISALIKSDTGCQNTWLFIKRDCCSQNQIKTMAIPDFTHSWGFMQPLTLNPLLDLFVRG